MTALAVILAIPVFLFSLAFLAFYSIEGHWSLFQGAAVAISFSMLYIGMVLSLKSQITLRIKKWIIGLLSCGTLGVLVFLIYKSDQSTWSWIITFESPIQWLMTLFPVLVAVISIHYHLQSILFTIKSKK